MPRKTPSGLSMGTILKTRCSRRLQAMSWEETRKSIRPCFSNWSNSQSIKQSLDDFWFSVPMKNFSFLCWLTSDKWPELQKRQEFPQDELAPWWKLLSPWREIQGYIITVSWKHVQTSNALNIQNVQFAKAYFVRGGKIIPILSIDIQCHLF